MSLPLETARFDTLKTLAGDRFGPITPAEENVLRLSASTSDQYPKALKRHVKVRAAFIRWLATEKDAAAHIDPLGLRVENATIASNLNLDFSRIPFRLSFTHCTLQGELSLISTELSALYLSNCKTEHGITSDVLRVQGSVSLPNLKAKGLVRLFGAQIGGDLDLTDATLSGGTTTLVADEARISGGAYLRGKFSSSGRVQFLNAHIGGDLECSGATFSGGWDTIYAVGAIIGGNVNLTGRSSGGKFSSSGTVQLVGAQIGGDLNCQFANFSSTGIALTADGARISGNLSFASGFLEEKFSSSGTVRFAHAQIGGVLDCRGASFSAKENALIADCAKISGGVFLTEKFCSSGTVRFVGALIGRDLDCSGATLSAEGNALLAWGAKIAGSIHFTEGFSSSGAVNFSGAQIEGDLICSGASFHTINCGDMQLAGNFIWRSIREPETAYLNLLGASIKTIYDDAASWPAPGRLVVKGLEYRELSHQESGAQTGSGNRIAMQRKSHAGERIGWLCLQSETDRLDPHAWMWLANLFKEKDDIDGYRQIICAYRCLKARALRNPTSRFVGLQMAQVERNPWSILWLFVPLLVIGTSVFWWAALTGKMPPASTDAYAAWVAGKPFPIAYPRFNPLVYTLENELPLVKFGMDDKWAPDPNLIATGKAWIYWSLAGFRWFLIVAGWIQGIMLSIGINRRFRD